MGYRATIAEIVTPFEWGGMIIAPPLRMLFKGETLRKGGTSLSLGGVATKLGSQSVKENQCTSNEQFSGISRIYSRASPCAFAAPMFRHHSTRMASKDKFTT